MHITIETCRLITLFHPIICLICQLYDISCVNHFPHVESTHYRFTALSFCSCITSNCCLCCFICFLPSFIHFLHVLCRLLRRIYGFQFAVNLHSSHFTVLPSAFDSIALPRCSFTFLLSIVICSNIVHILLHIVSWEAKGSKCIWKWKVVESFCLSTDHIYCDTSDGRLLYI